MGTCHILSRTRESFRDRVEAGQLLGKELSALAGEHPVVVAIPRGGVVVACGVVRATGGELDIVLSHKIGAPGNPELAIGSVSEDGRLFVDEALASIVGADKRYIDMERNRQAARIAERTAVYRRVHPKVPLAGRLVVVTDDGVATGATMEAALWSTRQERPSKLVAALPVGADEVIRGLARFADEVVCLRTPPGFSAVGEFYDAFGQVEDEEVIRLLADCSGLEDKPQ